MEKIETPNSFEGKYECDEEGYINLGDIAHGELRRQTQYVSYLVSGIGGRPKLGEGLNFKGDAGNYHEMRIHKNDVEEFIKRIKEYYGE